MGFQLPPLPSFTCEVLELFRDPITIAMSSSGLLPVCFGTGGATVTLPHPTLMRFLCEHANPFRTADLSLLYSSMVAAAGQPFTMTGPLFEFGLATALADDRCALWDVLKDALGLHSLRSQPADNSGPQFQHIKFFRTMSRLGAANLQLTHPGLIFIVQAASVSSKSEESSVYDVLVPAICTRSADSCYERLLLAFECKWISAPPSSSAESKLPEHGATFFERYPNDVKGVFAAQTRILMDSIEQASRTW